MQNRRIILASASPRRRELMAMAGYEFEIKVSHKEENYVSKDPSEIVKELALLKAGDIADQEMSLLKSERKTLSLDNDNIVASNTSQEIVVIGADTVVAHAGKILGKPKTEEEAFQMIKGFQGDKHQVYTGVAIIKFDAEGNKTVINDAIKTDVYVNAMTDEEIWKYIETDNVMDKAGAYGIQSGFAIHIEKIEGDYFNVVGLPISYIYEMLKR